MKHTVRKAMAFCFTFFAFVTVLLSIPASAAQQGTRIERIILQNFPEPIVGQTIDKTIKDNYVPSGAKYAIKSINWYDDANWRLKPTTFETGKTYVLSMEVTANTGYYFGLIDADQEYHDNWYFNGVVVINGKEIKEPELSDGEDTHTIRLYIYQKSFVKDTSETPSPSPSPSPSITTSANPMAVSVKTPVTISASKLKKKARTVKAITVTNAKGKVKYTKVSGSKKITLNKNGKITVKKGTKKGKYKMKVAVIAAGDKNYEATSKIVDVKVVVK